MAIPPLGAGLGRLPWPEVKARIVAAFAGVDDVDVRLWEPGYAPPAGERPVNTARPKMTGPRAMVLVLMDRFRVMDHEVTHLDVQKLAYFLQLAGAPLSMRFEAQRYGPYADGLYHVWWSTCSTHLSRSWSSA